MKAQPPSQAKSPRKRSWRYFRNLGIAAFLSLIPAYALVTAFKGVADSSEWAYPVRKALCCNPGQAKLKYEDVTFKTEDGLTLHGWYIPSTNGAAIMFVHGANDNRLQAFDVAHAMVDHGYGALLFDIRAHGDSEGDILSGVERDGVAAAAYLKTRPDVQGGKIGAWGFSLGGIVVIEAAAVTDTIRAVAADGPGPTVLDDEPYPQAFQDWLYVPYDLTFYPALQAKVGNFAKWPMTEAVKKIAPRPLYLMAARDFPFERRMTEGYFASAGNPKQIWLAPVEVHGTGWLLDTDEYMQRLAAFFDKALLNK